MGHFYCNVEVFGRKIYLKAHTEDNVVTRVEGDDPLNNDLFDEVCSFYMKFRRRDREGLPRKHDSRMCSSRYLESGNIDMRIELSEVYISIKTLCLSYAQMVQHKGRDDFELMDAEVIAYAVANLT